MMDTQMLGAGPKLKTRATGKLRPIHDGVLAYDMNFGERTTKGGIIIASDDGQEAGIRPRWCKIYAIGHENKDPYAVGNWIYVEHGRWSRGIILDDPDMGEIEVRLIDVNAILAWQEEEPEDLQIGTNTDFNSGGPRPEDFADRPR
jgi:co-chaperonin GroES (HSP10)